MPFSKKMTMVFALTSLLFLLSCAATPTRESTGEYLDDTVITTKIKTLLAKDALLKSFAVSAETFRGIVILSGFVNEQSQIDQAVSIAKGVKGVKEVKSNLVIKANK